MKQRKWTLLIALVLVCLALPVVSWNGTAFAGGLPDDYPPDYWYYENPKGGVIIVQSAPQDAGLGGAFFPAKTATPTPEPTATPTAKPTSKPTAKRTTAPSATPKPEPTAPPTAAPTVTPQALLNNTPGLTVDQPEETATPRATQNSGNGKKNTATPKPEILLHIDEIGKTSKVPSATRYQPVTIVSDAFSLTSTEYFRISYFIEQKDISLEITNSNRMPVKTLDVELLESGNGKKYILQCALPDTGAFAADRYTVRIKVPDDAAKIISFKTFIFDFKDPELDFAVQDEWTGPDQKTYWRSSGDLRVTVEYKQDGKGNQFEYAVYPKNAIDVNWVNVPYPAVLDQKTHFTIQLPEDLWDQECIIAIRRNGQDVVMHDGVLLRTLSLSLDSEQYMENCVYQGASELRMRVNRTGGTVILERGEDELRGNVSADGIALIDVTAWNLADEDTFTARYVNETTGEKSETTLSITVVSAGEITISPLGGIYLNDGADETVRFEVYGTLPTTRTTLQDAQGKQIGQPEEGTQIEFKSSDLAKAANIVCEYAQLQDSQVIFPILSLDQYDGSQKNCLVLIREQLALDQATLGKSGGTLTGHGAVPGRMVELYKNGTLMKPATADDKGAFSFTLTDLTPDQELTVKCTDILGQTRESDPALVLPLQGIAVCADDTDPYVYLNNAEGNQYYLNKKKTDVLPLTGTAHRNQKLAVLLNGVQLQDNVAVDENGAWKYDLPLALGSGKVTVKYQAFGEESGAAGTLAFEFYTPTETAITDVPGHIYAGDDTVTAKGDPYAEFTLLVDNETAARERADEDGYVTLKAEKAFEEGQQIVLKMTDIVGNEATQTGAHTVEQYKDLQAVLSGDSPYYLIPGGDLTLTVKGTSGQKVILYADKAREIKLGEWEIGEDFTLNYDAIDTVKSQLGLGQETKEISLYLVDSHSPDKEETITVTYDPACDLEPGAEWDALNKNTAQITGKTDPGATVTLLNGDSEILSTEADAAGQFTLTITEKPKGWANLTLKARDAAGNESEPLEKRVHFPARSMRVYMIPMGVGLLLFIAFLLVFLSARKKPSGHQNKKPLPTGTVQLPPRPRK